MTSLDLIPILIYVALFVAAIFITRAVFGIGKIVSHLKVQTALLVLIAEKLGADVTLVDGLSVEEEKKQVA